MLRLEDAYKGYTFDLDKLIPPEETVKRFKKRLKETGLDILEKTVRIDNGRLDIPVYFSICGTQARQLIGTRKQMGKGGTPAQAEASAIMELVERFSLFSFLKREFPERTYEEVKEAAISFEEIAKSVQDMRDAPRLYKVFSKLKLRWCRGYDLSHGKDLLIPIEWFFMINQYNGSSAGNCKEEAILQGVCEVVERDVSALISEKRIRVPLVDVSEVDDPLAKELLNKYKNAGIRLYINDFSLDTGIPTISVIAYDPVTFPELSEIVWTAGTTTNPEKSLIRALTEVAQLAGDFNTGSNYMPSGLPKPKNLDELKFLIESDSKISIHKLPDVSDPNIRVELENVIAKLKDKGLSTIAVDITHPVLKIPAFYTIIPGTRFRERAKGASLGMFMARLITEKNEPEKALHLLEEMDQLIPKRYYVSFFKAIAYMNMNALEEAISSFETSLKLEPNPEDIPTIYSYMGYCFKEQERYEEAINVLKKAEEHDNTRTDVYNLMGFCYFKLKEYEKAISCFKKVLKIDPGSAIDYANIAVNYEKLGDTDKAIQYYHIALELDPSIEFAKENLAKLISIT